jgi:site-specific recombinase XerD
MSMLNPNPNHDAGLTEPGSEPSDPPGPVDDLFAAAARRMSHRRSKPNAGPAHPLAMKELTGGSNPVDRYLANRNARPASMANYERKMRRAAELLVEAGFMEGADDVGNPREFPWHRIGVADADAFFQLLVRRYSSPKSRENLLGVVRSLLRQCVRSELLDRRTCDQLLDAMPVRQIRCRPAGRELSDAEIVALQRAVLGQTNPVLAARDSAILAAFLSTGMRVSEVVDLDVADYRHDDASLLVRVTKSNREVRVWLTDWARDQLTTWMAIRGDGPGALFLSRAGHRMCCGSVRAVIGRAVARAGITARTTTHDFRRTFITRMLRAGVDPYTVQRLVNHVNIHTTTIYDRRTDAEDREAVLRLQLPDLRLGGRAHNPADERDGAA